MPDPSNSWVTSANLTKDAKGNSLIALTVMVDDFAPYGNVEISGHATQSGGAFANFYDIQQVPDPTVDQINGAADGKAHRYIYVTTSPLPPYKFIQSEEVTVVMRVAKVWVSVVGQPDDPSQYPGIIGNSSPPTWRVVKHVANMDGGSWSRDTRTNPGSWAQTSSSPVTPNSA